MAKKLSQAEVAKRMVRLRNLEELYRRSKQRRRLQDELVAGLQALVENQNQLMEQQDKIIATQAIRITELETMVFGKKKRLPPSGTPPPTDQQRDTLSSGSSAKPRDKDSYRRPIPPDAAVTATVPVPVDQCQCGGLLTDLTTHERYIKDIPLPDLTAGYTAKLVTKYLVQRGISVPCVAGPPADATWVEP